MTFYGERYFWEIFGMLIPIHDYIEEDGKLVCIILEDGRVEEVNEGRIRTKFYPKPHK